MAEKRVYRNGQWFPVDEEIHVTVNGEQKKPGRYAVYVNGEWEDITHRKFTHKEIGEEDDKWRGYASLDENGDITEKGGIYDSI